MPRFNHLIGVGFSFDTDHATVEDTPVGEIIDAMQRRVDELRSLPADEASEAFEDLGDTYEHEDEVQKTYEVTVEDTTIRRYTVEADNPDEAQEIVEADNRLPSKLVHANWAILTVEEVGA